jgi:hypothetical protein
MKRILVTILTILYMTSATGATVYVHYCMGKFMCASLRHSDGGICGRCGMKKAMEKKGCCKDEQKTIKASDHQLAVASFDFFHPLYITAILSHTAFYRRPCYSGSVENIACANSPPSRWQTCPIYIQVRNFRI